jgi:hypothetical protein
VIILLPEIRGRPDEKIPVAGLRPSDNMTDNDNKGLSILRQLGGAYTRADANGHFEIEIPYRGRYLALAISNGQKRPRSGEDSSALDLRKLSTYFENPAALIGDRRYELRSVLIREGQELSVEFE